MIHNRSQFWANTNVLLTRTYYSTVQIIQKKLNLHHPSKHKTDLQLKSFHIMSVGLLIPGISILLGQANFILAPGYILVTQTIQLVLAIFGI